MTTRAAAAFFFALSVLYFLPAFLPGRHIYGTDYLGGGYAFVEYISQRMAAGTLPTWVPHVFGGLPLFANPGSTYHPLRLLADLLLPASRIWPALFVLHFAIAGLGTFLLAREIGTRSWVALLAGLAYQFTGLTTSWVYAGHEGRIIVAAMAPLVLFLFHRGIRTGEPAVFAGAAAAIGLALLTFQIQASYYLLLGTAIWSGFSIWSSGLLRRPRALLPILLLGSGAVVVGFVLAAINFLPFLDYIEQSPRGGGGRGYEYAVSWSMPAAELLAVAVPEHASHLESYRGRNPMKLHTEYMGATVIALVALGFAYARRNRYWWFFLALGLFFLTIALGGETPLYRLYYEVLPGTRRFRAPAIAFFMVSLSLVVMAAIALEALAQQRDSLDGRAPENGKRGTVAGPWRPILAATVVMGLLAGLLAAAAYVPRGVPPPGLAVYRFALFSAAIGAILWFWLKGSLRLRTTVLLLGALTVADLWVVGRSFFDTVQSPAEMFAPDDVVVFLRTREERDRVWTLPIPRRAVYRPQNANYLMHFDVHQAGGEHGNPLQRWSEFAGAGTETYIDWHNFLDRPAFLNAANVRYVISQLELDYPALRPVHRGSAIVYENTDALPRAFLVPEVLVTQENGGALEILGREGFDPRAVAVVEAAGSLDLPRGELTGAARITTYEPERVVIETEQDRAAFLVLADNYYPGWRALIDGRETTIYRTNHTFRGVLVGPGSHEVVFSFEPRDQYLGALLSVAALALLLGYASLLLFRRWTKHGSAFPGNTERQPLIRS